MKPGLVEEMRRRGVLRVAALYIVGAWLVVQVGDVFFPAWNIPEIAKRYLLLAAVLGFPIAVFFGWRYDLTPQGIRRTPPATGDGEPQGLGRGDHIALLTLSLAAIGIVYTATDRIASVTGDRTPVGEARLVEKRPNSIAVLPFENISTDPSNDAFCDGISEEILHRLGDYRDMHVVARTSSFAFRDSQVDAATMADLLGVRYLLQGSVRKDGDALRISAALVDDQNVQVWSRTFDRQFADVFAIQSEIATNVAGMLAATVLDSFEGNLEYEPDLAAYEQYLLGREYQRTRPPGWQASAIRFFDAASELDPAFAEPHAGRAVATMLSGRDAMLEDRLDGAEESILNALALNPSSAEALAAKGLLHLLRNEDAQAEQSLRQALEIDPNHPDAGSWLTNALLNQDKTEQAHAQQQLRLARDPMDVRLVDAVARGHADRGEFELAERQYLRLHQLPRVPELAFSALFSLYDEYGRNVQLIAAAKRRILAHAVPDSEPHFYFAYLAFAYARVGMFDKAEYWQNRAESHPPVDLGTHMRRAYIYRLRGMHEESRAVAERAVAGIGAPIERTSPFIRRVVGAIRIFAGDYEAGIALSEPTFDLSRPFHGAYLDGDLLHSIAWAYRQRGNESRAREIFDLVEAGIEARRSNGGGQSPLTALLYAQNEVLQSRIEPAIDWLEVAVDRGLRRYHWVLHDNRWDVARDNERFQAALSVMRAGVEQQRAEIEAIDAAEDFAALLDQKLAISSP